LTQDFAYQFGKNFTAEYTGRADVFPTLELTCSFAAARQHLTLSRPVQENFLPNCRVSAPALPLTMTEALA